MHEDVASSVLNEHDIYSCMSCEQYYLIFSKVKRKVELFKSTTLHGLYNKH